LRVAGLHVFPRIRQGPLDAQRDAVFCPVEVEDDRLDRLAHGESVTDVFHAAPADLGDRQQGLDAADVDKGAEVPQGLHDARHHHPLVKRSLDGVLSLALLLFEDPAPREDDPAPPLAVLDDDERQPLADEGRRRFPAGDACLRKGAERPVGSCDADLEPALDFLLHDALDGDCILPGLFEILAGGVPGNSRREHPLALPRREVIDLDGVAFLDRQLPVLVEKLVALDDPLGLAAEVDEHPVRRDLGDHRLHALPLFEPERLALGGLQEFSETLFFFHGLLSVPSLLPHLCLTAGASVRAGVYV